MSPPPAFQAPIPISSPPSRLASTHRRHRPRLCQTPPTPPPPPNLSVPRRLFIITAASITLSTFAPSTPPPSHALTLAPTPINPYARRRRERTYHEYAQKLEAQIEAVAMADFKKVVSAGGGGLGVSYRVVGFAAFVASALSTAVVHPLDSLKTRMQAGLEGGQLMRGLYNGLWSNVLKEAPNAAIYLGLYEVIKNALMGLTVTSFFHDIPLVTFLVAGALGDAVGSLVRVPAEVVNKRLQLGVNRDWKEAVREALGTPEGRDASMVAWQAVLLRDVPYGGLQIMFYEFGKLMVGNHAEWFWGVFAKGGLFVDVIVGALAGALAAMVTTPADVLVTRLSVQNTDKFVRERGGYVGVGNVVRMVLMEEGVFGLFRGMWQRGLYYAPLIGLFFALYEFNRSVIEHPHSVLARGMEVVEPVTRALAGEWHMLPGQVSAVYSATMPVFAGMMSVLSDQLPVLLSFATVN